MREKKQRKRVLITRLLHKILTVDKLNVFILVINSVKEALLMSLELTRVLAKIKVIIA